MGRNTSEDDVKISPNAANNQSDCHSCTDLPDNLLCGCNKACSQINLDNLDMKVSTVALNLRACLKPLTQSHKHTEL